MTRGRTGYPFLLGRNSLHNKKGISEKQVLEKLTVPFACTAGFSLVYEMNCSNKSISINVFQLRGVAFIPDNENADIGRESDAKTHV
jgi:hypothetical protein